MKPPYILAFWLSCAIGHCAEISDLVNQLKIGTDQTAVQAVCDLGKTGHLAASAIPSLVDATRRQSPAVRILTTGVDAPTCKNVVLARVVNSMTEFKQIIGRGTRVRDDYGKLFFNILDYTGSATQLFADPEFDGEPARIAEAA